MPVFLASTNAVYTHRHTHTHTHTHTHNDSIRRNAMRFIAPKTKLRRRTSLSQKWEILLNELRQIYEYVYCASRQSNNKNAFSSSYCKGLNFIIWKNNNFQYFIYRYWFNKYKLKMVCLFSAHSTLRTCSVKFLIFH